MSCFNDEEPKKWLWWWENVYKSTHIIKTLNSFLKGDCLYTIYSKVGGGGGDYVSM